jgi:hypothetical protein
VQWLYPGWKHFGGILPVAVQKSDEIESVLDRVAKTNLLIAAVSLTDRIVAAS